MPFWCGFRYGAREESADSGHFLRRALSPGNWLICAYGVRGELKEAIYGVMIRSVMIRNYRKCP